MNKTDDYWIANALEPNSVSSVRPFDLESTGFKLLYLEPASGYEPQTLNCLLEASLKACNKSTDIQLLLVSQEHYPTETPPLADAIGNWLNQAGPQAQNLDMTLLKQSEISDLGSLLAAVEGVIFLAPLKANLDSFYQALQALAFDKQLLLLPDDPVLFSDEVCWVVNTLSPSELVPALQQLISGHLKTGMQPHYGRQFSQEVDRCWQDVQNHWQAGDHEHAAALCEVLNLKKHFNGEELVLMEAIFKANGNEDAVQEIQAVLDTFQADLGQSLLFVCGLSYEGQTPISRNRCDQVYQEAFQRACEYIGLHNIAGNFVEFGTYYGYTAKIMADFLSLFNMKHSLYLFDSFEGLPEIASADILSYEVSVRKVWLKGDLTTNPAIKWLLERALSKILSPERVHVIKGFFSDTLSSHLPNEPIALLHLDCDLYSSSYEVLQAVLSRGLLQDGTIMMCDDFGSNRAHPHMGQRRAVSEAFAAQTRYSYSSFFTYGWGSEAFFIHDMNALETIQHALTPSI